MAGSPRRQHPEDAQYDVPRPGKLWVVGQCISVVVLLATAAVITGLPYFLLCWALWDKGGGLGVTTLNVAVGLVVSQYVQRWMAALVYVVVKRCTPIGVVPIGEHLMYSTAHFRLWFLWRLWDRCLGNYADFGSINLLQSLDGTRCSAAFYHHILGGIGIHSNALLDVHSSGGEVLLPEYVKIGRRTAVNAGAKIRPFSLHRGVLTVRPITVGNGCHLGSGCMLMPGTAVDSRAVLGPLTVMQPGAKAARQDEIWVGNPPRRVRDSPYEGAEFDPLSENLGQANGDGGARNPLLATPRETGAGSCGWLVAALELGMSSMPILVAVSALASVLPTTAIALKIYEHSDESNVVPVIVALPALALGGDLCLLIFTVLLRKLVLGMSPLEPACVARRSWHYAQLWSLRRMFHAARVAAAALDTTPVWSAWLSAVTCDTMGACGTDTATDFFGLADIRPGCFLGRGSSLCTMVFSHSHLFLNKVALGDGCSVSEGACLPPGVVMDPCTHLGPNSVLSVADASENRSRPQSSAGSSWLGAPAIAEKQPRRVQFAGERPDDSWSCCGVAQALLVKSFDVGLLASLVSAVCELLQRTETVGVVSLVVKLTWVYVLYVLSAAAFCIILKWLLLGKVKSQVVEHGSVWCGCHDLVFRLLRWPQGHIVSVARGTVIHRWYLMALGADIGADAYLEVDTFPEPDLVQIGEGAVIMDGVGLNACSVMPEDGRLVRRSEAIKVGRGAHVDCGTQLMPGCTVAAGSSIGALAVVKAGDTVGTGAWAGVPAQPLQWAPEPMSAWAKRHAQFDVSAQPPI